uniref:TonB-dependent siderophore receptor n=1 Tax=Gluconobacter thailandicus TaxID=257438 RepID=UPI0009EF6A10
MTMRVALLASTLLIVPVCGFFPASAQDILKNKDDKDKPLGKMQSSNKTTEHVEVVGKRSIQPSEQNGLLTVQATAVATHFPLTLRETPQSVTVITRRFLDDFTLQNANDALSHATGITVQRVETERTYVSARGFDVSNYQYDGIGLPFAQGTQTGAIDTAVYDSVAVLRGANGLLSSTGNPAATVDYTRKRATRDFQASVEGTVGSWNKRRVVGDISGSPLASGRLRGRLVAVYENGDSYLARYSQEKTVVYGTIEGDLDAYTTVRLGYTWQQNNPNSSMWGALPLYYTDGSPTRYSRSTSTASDWSYMNNRDSQMFADISRRIGSDWSVRLYAFHRVMQTDGNLFYAYGTPDRETGLGLYSYPSRYTGSESQWIGDLSTTGAFRLGGRMHQLAFGVNAASSRTRQLSNYSADIGTALPALEGWSGNYPQPPFTAYDETAGFTQTRESLYGVLRLNPFRNAHLFGGVNLTHAESNGASYGVASNYSATRPSPYAGFTYDFLKHYTFYVSYSKIFNPQSELDASRKILGPVNGDNLEGGVKAAWFDNRLNVSLTGFHVHQNHLADFAGYFSDGQSYYRTINAQSAGVEFDISGQLTRSLQIMAGGTLMKIYDENGDPVRTYVPRQTLHGAITWQVPYVPHLRVGTNITWQGRIWRDQGVLSTSGNEIVTRQHSYALVDLMAHYDLGRHWQFTGNLNNVSSHKYLTSLYWDQSYYGAPFSGSFTLRHQF